MTTTITVSCAIEANEPGLTLAASADGRVFWQGDPWKRHLISLDLTDDDQQHTLAFELKGKRTDHTRLDSDGKIIHDVAVVISDLAFDGMELGHLFYEKAVYTHDFNGTGPRTLDRFYGTMGCNGTVTLEFSCPFYIWLLESM